jgi:hypothetical protein
MMAHGQPGHTAPIPEALADKFDECRPVLVVGDRRCAVTDAGVGGASPEEEVVILGGALESGIEFDPKKELSTD